MRKILPFILLLSFSAISQPKQVPDILGIFYYKDGRVLYVLNNQRSIIAQMNQRFTRPKLDSVYLCERGGEIRKSKPFKKYIFK
jgi:hypothetical protein